MKNVLYYHTYLTDDLGTWTGVLLEQFKCIEDANLFLALDEIRMTCITQLDMRTEILRRLCETYPVNFRIDFVANSFENDKDMIGSINSDRTITENHTYRTIYNDCQNEDMRICYIHSKGITSSLKLHISDVQQYKNYYYWRQYLNWGVIENWKACVNALQDHDVAGVNYYDKPSKHFSGNFWWSTSKYIRRLPDPATIDWWRKMQRETSDQWLKYASDRFRDEQWLCSLDDVKVYNIYKLNQSENPAASFLPRKRYENEVY